MSQTRHRKKKKKNGAKVFLAALLLTALFIMCIYGAYTLMANSSPYINPSPSPTAKAVQGSTAQPTPAASASPAPASARSTARPSATSTPRPTVAASSSPVPSSGGGFTSYDNDTYGFSCPYPQSFAVYSGGDPDAKLSLRSPDGGAYEHIFASTVYSDTPAMDMREFVSSYPTGIIIENYAGNDYFYALIKYEDNYVYRYAAYNDGSVKGFEFGYSESSEDRYSEYPSEIRSDFMLY